MLRDINDMFFELIRVAIGIQDMLSLRPSSEEWAVLYDMASKQSLIGVCYAGVQKMCDPDADDYCEMSEIQYFNWMGAAVQIQQRNEVINKHCFELQQELDAEGFRSCILKGQGVAALYSENLQLMRQSGDIDVWMQDKSIEEIVDYCKSINIKYQATAAHVGCELFEDTEVELHSVPAFLRCPWHNARLQAWFREHTDVEELGENGFSVPSLEFNLVYMMIHMYHHILFEGLGLRQVMDYYYVLRTLQESGSFKSQEFQRLMEDLGMLKFAQGMMWVIDYVFVGQNPFSFPVEQNEKLGRLILEEIMKGGNFGRYNDKNKGLHCDSAILRSINSLKRNMRFFALGTAEVLCSPFWSLWHWGWRKCHNYC